MSQHTLQNNMVSNQKKSTFDQQIDENLKRAYDSVLKQDLPDKFLDLIAKLKSSDQDEDGK